MDSEIDRASNLMGKYLLSGWVMTDTVCSTPNCNVPLLRSKNSTIWFCVLCNEEPGKPILQTKQLPKISSPPNIVNRINGNNNNSKMDSIQQNSTHLEKDNNMKDNELQQQQIQRDQSQNASHLIGQYLLQGWALIDQVCPNKMCYGIPLVRSRDKKKYCVICHNYYVNESEFDPLKHNVTTHNVEQIDSSSRSNMNNEKKHQINIKEIEFTVQQLGEKAQSLNDTTTTLGQNVSGIDNHQHDAVQKCIATLSSKLEELSILLENTSNVSDIKNICDTIKSCAHALEAVRSSEHPQDSTKVYDQK